MLLRKVGSMALLALTLGACGGESAPQREPSPRVTAEERAAPEGGQVCAGASHTCVLQPTGTVICAGRNRDGQLGDGTAQDRLTFVPVVGLTSAIDIDCAYDHTCAARADGHVVCWGRGADGQLGRLVPAVQTPIEVAGITDAVEVSTGRSFSCARRSSGAVACWGEGGDGQLGGSAAEDSAAPVAVSGLSDAAEIDSGAAHTCVRRSTGAITCWGSNRSGALGTGDTIASDHPAAVAGVEGATLVAAAGDHSCALSAAGVQCWGANEHAQIGNGNEGEASVTAPVTIEGVTGASLLALGARRTCAATASQVRCWGHNDYASGLLGIRSDALRNILTPTVVPGIVDAVAMASGDDFTCAIRRGGALSCWGAGDDGQMGENDRRGHPAQEVVLNVLTLAAPPSVVPVFAPTPDAVVTIAPHLALGRSHVCTVVDGGRVRCFGENGEGQLGNGSTISLAASRAEQVPGITDALRVYAADQTTCVVRANGAIACWGALAGLRSTSLPQSSSLPVPMAIDDATALAIASGSFCAVTHVGRVACLGEGGSGQLGNGATDDSATPVEVVGLSDVRAIAATSSTFCALRSGGTVACWGYDGYGECGNGEAAPCGATPVDVARLTHVRAIDGGGSDFCAVAGAAIACWGANEHGQLGTGSVEPAHVDAPVAVRGLPGASDVGVGAGSACATTSVGEAYCWGSSALGAPGTDDASPVQVSRSADEDVAALGPFLETDCGSSFCCGIHRDGHVSCWGAPPLGGADGPFGASSLRSDHPIVVPGVLLSMPAAPD